MGRGRERGRSSDLCVCVYICIQIYIQYTLKRYRSLGDVDLRAVAVLAPEFAGDGYVVFSMSYYSTVSSDQGVWLFLNMDSNLPVVVL